MISLTPAGEIGPWSIHSHAWCAEVQFLASSHPMGALCQLPRGHVGLHRNVSVATGDRVVTEWSECFRPSSVCGPPKVYRVGHARKLSEETKRKIRRKALARRISAKAPLFAEQLFAEAVEKQPDYFGR